MVPPTLRADVGEPARRRPTRLSIIPGVAGGHFPPLLDRCWPALHSRGGASSLGTPGGTGTGRHHGPCEQGLVQLPEVSPLKVRKLLPKAAVIGPPPVTPLCTCQQRGQVGPQILGLGGVCADHNTGVQAERTGPCHDVRHRF